MNKPKKTKKPKAKLIFRKRSLSRLIAVQIFYQFEFYEKKSALNEIKNDIIDNYVLRFDDNISSYRDNIDQNLLESLIAGINFGYDEIDREIFSFLKSGWNLEKLPEIMLYILRLGAFELKFMSEIPLKVVIDEYVDIAASFFENKKITFLNATLESLAKKYRPQEFLEIKNIPNLNQT
ncbi:MAG: transcription antitermination factor NusB [Rickettsiales bacterium]|nr:transcription antitermination factor NusB [Rickettsiales bacterium]